MINETHKFRYKMVPVGREDRFATPQKEELAMYSDLLEAMHWHDGDFRIHIKGGEDDSGPGIILTTDKALDAKCLIPTANNGLGITLIQ